MIWKLYWIQIKNFKKQTHCTNQDLKSVYKHIMHHIKANVHFKGTLGNKTDNQTPLIMQEKVQNITNKQKNEILKQEEWKEGKLFPCTERQMSWNMTSKISKTNSC